MGAEIVGLKEVGHFPRVGILDLEFDGPVPTVPVDLGDAREPVTSPEELESYPLRTVVKIELEIPDGSEKWRYRGTGFLVGPRHVLTNHHVVDDHNDGDINPMIDASPTGFSF